MNRIVLALTAMPAPVSFRGGLRSQHWWLKASIAFAGLSFAISLLTAGTIMMIVLVVSLGGAEPPRIPFYVTMGAIQLGVPAYFATIIASELESRRPRSETPTEEKPTFRRLLVIVFIFLAPLVGIPVLITSYLYFIGKQ